MSSETAPLGEPTPRTKRLAGLGALAGGIVAVVGLFAGGIMALDELGDLLADPLVVALFLYAVVGAAVVGATVSLLYARYRLYAPALVAVGVVAYAGVRTGLLFRSPAVAMPGTPVEIAFLAWPLVFLAALLVGSVERVVRKRIKTEGAAD